MLLLSHLHAQRPQGAFSRASATPTENAWLDIEKTAKAKRRFLFAANGESMFNRQMVPNILDRHLTIRDRRRLAEVYGSGAESGLEKTLHLSITTRKSPGRKPMRLSISTLLTLMVLSGAARADEAAAIKLVEKLGGTVTRDDKQPGKPVIEVEIFNAKVTDADLKELKELKQLTTLGLVKCKGMTSDGFKELKELKQLTWLELNSTSVTDASVKELKELKKTREAGPRLHESDRRRR